jgi:phosphoinositide-3-kinase, regulatory subunit 4
MRVLQTMENPRHHGSVTCLCLDRKRVWVVTGTTRGVLALWDLRFGILLKCWRVGASSGGKTPRIRQCVLHPTRGKGRWIMVALETQGSGQDSTPTNLLEVWDIEKMLLMETYATREVGPNTNAELPPPTEVSAQLTDESPAAAIAALVRSRQQSRNSLDWFTTKRPAQMLDVPGPASLDIRALIVGPDFGGSSSTFHKSVVPVDLASDSHVIDWPSSNMRGGGFMLTGSEDRKLRMWDLNRVERSVVLSGLETQTERPSYR